MTTEHMPITSLVKQWAEDMPLDIRIEYMEKLIKHVRALEGELIARARSEGQTEERLRVVSILEEMIEENSPDKHSADSWLYNRGACEKLQEAIARIEKGEQPIS